MSNKIQAWKKTPVTLEPNQIYAYNLSTLDSNIIQIINRKASGGGSVFFDVEQSVSSTSYMMSVDMGHVQTMAFPYALKTVYLETNSATPLDIEVVEIKSDEFMFAFNSAQLVNIQGNVQVQEPVTVDGTVSISGEVEVKNDAGNPIPVSMTQDVYTTQTVTVAGATQVKAAGGKVSGIMSDGTAVATIQDANGNRWATKNESHFTEPITCVGHITVSLDVAGNATIIFS